MKPAVIAIVCVLIGQSARSLAAPPLGDILKWLEQANQTIGVVKTEGDTHYYLWDDSASSWKVTPETCTFSCVFENRPNGRYVLDEHPSLTRWISGAAPYLAKWSTDFRDANGFTTHWERALQYHDDTNFLSAPFERNEVYRSKKSEFYNAMAQQAERSYSGLGYTGLGAVKNIPVYIPALSKDIVVTDTADGMTRLQFLLSEYCVAFDVVLDPKKNFALVRYTYSQSRELTTEDDEFSMTYDVLEHRQIADGIWYPIHCTMTTTHSKEYAALMRSRNPPQGDQDPYDPYRSRKSEFLLTKVAILEGRDAETNLTVTLPDGLTIRNVDEPDTSASRPR